MHGGYAQASDARSPVQQGLLLKINKCLCMNEMHTTELLQSPCQGNERPCCRRRHRHRRRLGRCIEQIDLALTW